MGVQERTTFIFSYDAYVRVEANSKEEADHLLQQAEGVFEAINGAARSLFDAYGIEDAETGEELRSVQ